MAAAAGGVLYFLAFLGFGYWPFLAVFLVPLWWALDGEQGLANGAFLGFLFGCVAYAGGHPFLLELVDVFLVGSSALGFGLWLLYGGWFALRFMVYGAFFVLLRRRGGGLAGAAVPAWILIEWLHPLLFPVHCGAGLVSVLPLAQLAELGGPLLLSFLVLGTNLFVFETVSWALGRRSRPHFVWIAALLMFPGSFVYGSIRIIDVEKRLETAPSLRVGLVQANLGTTEKRSRAVVGHRLHLDLTRELLAEGEVDLIIWPETAYAQAIQGPLPVSGRLVQQAIPIPLLFGAPILDASGPEGRQANAALLVGRDGMIREAYRKNLLIPLAESNPLQILWPGLAERLPYAQTFTAADTVPALRLDDWRISVPICYEAVRPSFVRRMVREGEANLIVTLANDGWFGDSQEPKIHLGLARLRAIEHRRFLVRATNSGISAIIDPMGRILSRTGVLERSHLRAEVRGLTIQTVYGQFGNWPGGLAGVWWICVVLPALGRRRIAASSRHSAEHPPTTA